MQTPLDAAFDAAPEVAPLASIEATTQRTQRELWTKRAAWIFLLGMSAVILTSIIYKPTPVNAGDEYFTICGFKNLTGLPCPGCGLTHSFCEIGKGHLASALNWNWLGLPLFILMVLVWLQSLFILTNRVKPAWALDRLAARVRPMRWFAIVFALYGIGRIVYILLYNPAAQVSTPLSKLLKLIGG
ncbi:MAG: DUF2752 domain-containing protein [Acidobacteria bacterium]|nr:DUF2752 domain-containing protein [Acidobacteriota bacterium]